MLTCFPGTSTFGPPFVFRVAPEPFGNRCYSILLSTTWAVSVHPARDPSGALGECWKRVVSIFVSHAVFARKDRSFRPQTAIRLTTSWSRTVPIHSTADTDNLASIARNLPRGVRDTSRPPNSDEFYAILWDPSAPHWRSCGRRLGSSPHRAPRMILKK